MFIDPRDNPLRSFRSAMYGLAGYKHYAPAEHTVS